MGKSKGTKKQFAVTDACIFCGNPFGPGRSRSDEHVLGSAILERLGFHKVAMRINHIRKPSGYLGRGTFEAAKRDRIAGNDVAQRVICEPCNNEWMSGLESKCIDVIEALAKRRTAPDLLTLDQRRDLARWATKTGLVIAHAKQLKLRSFPRELYEDVMNGTDKAGAVAFVSRLPGCSVVTHGLNGVASLYGDTHQVAESIMRRAEGHLVASAVYGDLLIGVAFTPLGQQHLAFPKGVCELFWPPEPQVAYVDDYYTGWEITPTSADIPIGGIGLIFTPQQAPFLKAGFTPNEHLSANDNKVWSDLLEQAKQANSEPWTIDPNPNLIILNRF